MENLYSDAISKLQKRVETLETKSTPASNQSQQAPSRNSSHGMVKDRLISSKANKAIPKIGRVVPGGRR